MFLFSVRLWCYAAFAAGIVFSVLAVYSGAYFLNFQHRSVATIGTITSVDVDPDGDKNLYCPHFRFEAADKKTYTGSCRVWQRSAIQPLLVGAAVSIRYKSSDPNDAWLEAQVHGYPRESTIAGVFGRGVGFALLWHARRCGISLKVF